MKRIALFIVALGLSMGGYLLTRIDIARSSADRSAARVAQSTHVQGVNAELALCRRRTEHLRGTLEVLILSNAHWPQRVELPRLEGWPAWPSPGGVGEADAR